MSGFENWALRGAIQLSVIALALVGCMAPVGVTTMSVPPDAAATCSSHCQTMGMRLSAVAVMANNVGCVCEPARPNTPIARSTPAQAGERSTPVAGMTALLMQQEEEEEEQARQNEALRQQTRAQQQRR